MTVEQTSSSVCHTKYLNNLQHLNNRTKAYEIITVTEGELHV